MVLMVDLSPEVQPGGFPGTLTKLWTVGDNTSLGPRNVKTSASVTHLPITTSLSPPPFVLASLQRSSWASPLGVPPPQSSVRWSAYKRDEVTAFTAPEGIGRLFSTAVHCGWVEELGCWGREREDPTQEQTSSTARNLDGNRGSQLRPSPRDREEAALSRGGE
ncbi:hypothetical protein COCON_G00123670 [Conger conger]|uniref:Uncharacterized protein n=1 Tax=Conger conger TaxID=82655 RepID=A0A9Q1DI06_CONCO|nr:hypothetical protein COCON_G00123670 [Conger conger]